jgi:hypothetical protein
MSSHRASLHRLQPTPPNPKCGGEVPLGQQKNAGGMLPANIHRARMPRKHINQLCGPGSSIGKFWPRAAIRCGAASVSLWKVPISAHDPNPSSDAASHQCLLHGVQRESSGGPNRCHEREEYTEDNRRFRVNRASLVPGRTHVIGGDQNPRMPHGPE